MVKNQPAMPELVVRFLGWEDPLEQCMQPTPVFLPGEFHGHRSLVCCIPWGPKNTTEQLIFSSLNKQLEGKLQPTK